MSYLSLLHELGAMHQYCRPHGSQTEQAFIEAYVSCLPGATLDDFHNWHVDVGDGESTILYSCHTDTVHDRSEMQRINLTDGRLHLSKRSRKRSACLGADDTVGVFLCRRMILAGVPGHYIFHYGEEIGCQGSRDLAAYDSAFLERFEVALAFDRKGTTDVITHQRGSRTASDAFAYSLAAQLNTIGLHYAPSDRGLYTDTDSYADLVPECSNLSIGYDGNHSDRESVNVAHVFSLLEALKQLDPAQLVITRDPSVDRWDGWTRKGTQSYICIDAIPDDDDVDDPNYISPEDWREYCYGERHYDPEPYDCNLWGDHRDVQLALYRQSQRLQRKDR